MIVWDLIYATNFDGRHIVMFDNDDDDDDDDLEDDDTSYNLSYAPLTIVGQRW